MDVHEIIKLLTNVIFPICGILITYFVIPWIRAKITAERLDTIESWAWNAVQAAEKIFPAGLNADKYDYAVTFIRDQAKKHGVILDEDEVRTLIESAVNMLPKTHEEV